MAATAKTITEYLESVPLEFRLELERIRALVTRLVPEIEERISYRMPTLMYRGRALVYFTASKQHMSFYPSSWALEAERDRLKPWSTTEHAIRFTLEDPLPEDLIEDLVRAHQREIDAGREE